MNEKTIIFDEQEVSLVADYLVSRMPFCKVFAFNGPLGAGKTTLIQHMLHACGVKEPVTSPTFTYVTSYENSAHQLFYHFDLYRMERLDDFLAAGFNEYVYALGSWAFIEWPTIVMPLLKEKVCYSELDYEGSKRKLIIKEI